MRSPRISTALFALPFALVVSAASAQPGSPRLLAPATETETATLDSRCPTFHWSGTAAAAAYEVVLYGAPDTGAEPAELYRKQLPADVRSWTASGAFCLGDLDRYAWAVRAVQADGTESWSGVGVFEISSAPQIGEVEEALAVLRRWLDSEETSETGDNRGSGAGASRSTAPTSEVALSAAAVATALAEPPPARPAPGAPLSLGPPSLSPNPSLVVDGQIHLATESAIFKGGRPFLWGDRGFGNLALGHDALTEDTGTHNTAIGFLALNSSGRVDSGNVAVGAFAMTSLQNGSYNVAVGAQALSDDFFAGNGNLAIGQSAGKNLRNGSDNIYIGHDGRSADTSVVRLGRRDKHFNTYLAGEVAIGFADDEWTPVEEQDTPKTLLVVRGQRDGSGNVEADNIVWFENTDDAGSGDVLALKIGEATLESDNNFITFLNASDASVGAIEGDGAGGVTTASSGADYAEYLERVDSGEELGPGDVVGVFGNRIGSSTKGADRVMVISTAPIVLGNDPGDRERDRYERVAFLGQAPVRTVGPVRSGDVLIASGLGDRTARALAPAAITASELPRLIGRALESSDDDGEKTVRAIVGVPDPGLLAAVLVARERDLLARIEAQWDARTTVLTAEPSLSRTLCDPAAPTAVREAE